MQSVQGMARWKELIAQVLRPSQGGEVASVAGHLAEGAAGLCRVLRIREVFQTACHLAYAAIGFGAVVGGQTRSCRPGDRDSPQVHGRGRATLSVEVSIMTRIEANEHTSRWGAIGYANMVD